MGDMEKDYQWDRSFDVDSEVEEVVRLARLRRKKKQRRSVLDRYRGELVALYDAGLSFAQLALWLQCRKRIKVSRTAIHRRMREWPEVTIRGVK